MKRFAVLLVSLMALCAPAHAQPSTTFCCARAQLCGGYIGPGDAVISTLNGTVALAAYSLWAWQGSLCGNAVANVCNSTGGTDVACADMVTGTTTGQLVPATIGGITCPGANCTIKTMYDQLGSNNCSGSCNVTQATIANRPTLAASCTGITTGPCGVAGSTSVLQSAGNMTATQPFSAEFVGTYVSGSSGFAPFFGLGVSYMGVGMIPDSNLYISCDATVGNGGQTTTANTWFAYGVVCNRAAVNDNAYLNGSNVANGNWGTNSQTGQLKMLYGNGLVIEQVEMAVWGFAMDSSHCSDCMAALSANQRARIGF